MNPINYGEIKYNSKYGKYGIRQQAENNSDKNINPNTYNPKFRAKIDKNALSLFTTISLMFITGVIAYKGNAKIKNFITKTKLFIDKTIQDFCSKYYNMAQAGKSLKEAGGHFKDACKKPADKVKKVSKIITMPFKTMFNETKKIFSDIKNNK